MDCWPVDSFAVPLKDAVAALRRVDTSSPDAAGHEGPPLADFVDKSVPGLSGATRPLEPILEQEESPAAGGQPSPRDEDAPAMNLITEANGSGQSSPIKRSL